MSQRGRGRGGRGGRASTLGKRVIEEPEESSSEEGVSSAEESSSEYESSDDSPPATPARGGGARGGRGGGRGSTTTTTTTTSTRSTQSTPQKSVSASEITTNELNKLVDEFVRFVLFADRKKLPITRADIVAKVLSNYRDKKIITMVFTRGGAKLKDVFGYELVEIKKEKSASSEKDTSTNTFILKNLLPLELMNQIQAIDSTVSKELALTQQQRALLTVILAVILLECGFVDSDQLQVYLGRLGFEAGTQHPVYGEWEKCIDRFVKELYITKKKTEKDRAVIFQYRFGPRALAETTKKNIIRVVGDVYGVEEIDPMILKQLEIEGDDNDQDESEEEQEVIPIITRPQRATAGQSSQQASQRAQTQTQASQPPRRGAVPPPSQRGRR